MHSFLRLDSLHVYTEIVYLCHDFCTHSFVYGHLDCFRVLAIVNTAGLNICAASVFSQFWFPQGVCLEVGLLGCTVLLYGKQDEDSLRKWTF